MVNVFEKISLSNVFWSIVFIAIAFIIWFVISKFRNRIFQSIEESKKDVVRKKALVTSVCNVIKLALIIFTLLTVLQINGINVGSVAAGLGIAGAVAAVAVQDVIKDVIQGIRLFTDGFFAVGDCVNYNGEDYQVVEYTLRTTKLKSMINGNVRAVSNRNITEISKISGQIILKIPTSYSLEPEKADEVFNACVEEMSKVKGISRCKYLGLNTFEESAIVYLISFYSKPTEIYAMKRAAMRIIKDRFDKEGITIPFNQLDIHSV